MQLVMVRWRDAETTQGWTDLDEARKHKPPLCITIGWLVKQSKTEIVVAHTKSGREVNGQIVIPRAWVEGEIVKGTIPK